MRAKNEFRSTPFDEALVTVNTSKSRVNARDYLSSGRLPVVDQSKNMINGFVNDGVVPILPGDSGVIVFGDHTCITKYIDFPFVVGADGTKVLRPRDPSKVLMQYVGYLLEEYPVATTGYNRHFSILRERSFDLPDMVEQHNVARILKDLDAQTAVLESIIDKKRDMKQGLMQELLTGRTRLPGFDEAWVTRTLGEVARIKTGSRNNQDKVTGGRYPFFVRSAIVERIDSYSYDCEAILVPGEGGVSSIFHYIDGKFEVHQRVYRISDFVTDVSGKFIYQYMRQFFGGHALGNTVKATVDSLRLPTFTRFELKLPPTRDEQDAIASVLWDADAEMSALERRLESARAVRQGMMQELLSGRTRLVTEVVA